MIVGGLTIYDKDLKITVSKLYDAVPTLVAFTGDTLAETIIYYIKGPKRNWDMNDIERYHGK